ncbi:MAG: hypothetical protein HY337_08225 [Gemmatimonadetes bacterium]|nr:hypothetical protein [Gemmatimonadota bacterium]
MTAGPATTRPGGASLAIAVSAAIGLLGCDSLVESGSIAIVLSQETVTIPQGNGTTVTVTVTRTNFDKVVLLEVEGAPAGVTAQLSATSLAAGVTRSSLEILVESGATPGAATLTLRATGDGVEAQTAALEVTVTVTGQYTLSVLEPVVTVAQGGAGSATIVVTRAGGFSGSVALSVTGAPSGATAALNPANAPGAAVALSLAATAGTPPGTYNLTLTGTTPGLPDRTTTMAFVVIPPPSTAEMTLTFCPTSVPIWFAFQNQGYAWQPVTAAGNSFTFAATDKVGLAWVLQYGAATEVFVRHATRSEHAAVFLDGLCSGSNGLTGSVAGLYFGQSAKVAMGTVGVTATASATGFALQNVPNRPLDLVATRGVQAGFRFTPDSMILRRTQDPANGTTIPALDFSTAEAFALDSAGLTLTGLLPGDQVLLTNRLWTATSTFGTVQSALLFAGATTTATTTLYGVPQGRLVAGDVHELWVDVYQSNVERRSHIAYFGAPTSQTDALGPYVSISTVTRVTDLPYPRMRGRLDAQPEYDRWVRFIFGGLSGAARNVHVMVSAAYLAGTPATWDVVTPDFSGTPFQSGWMPADGQAPYYQVDASSAWFRVTAAAGDVVRYSTRAGPIGAAQLARAPTLIVAALAGAATGLRQ